jgi:hypothetical protein
MAKRTKTTATRRKVEVPKRRISPPQEQRFNLKARREEDAEQAEAERRRGRNTVPVAAAAHRVANIRG